MVRGKLRPRVVLAFAALAAFALLTASPALQQTLWSRLFPGLTEAVYPRSSLMSLLREHVLLVLAALGASSLTGILLAVLATRESGRAFAPAFMNAAAVAQTFPPAAVLALAVPIVGFGFKPAFLALWLYGLFPVAANTVAGIDGIDPAVKESARAMGLGPLRRILEVELPLASPVVLTGIRTASAVTVGTATLGAVVGAGGLGAPIVAGLVRDNPAFIAQGALAAAAVAWTLDAGLGRIRDFLLRHEKAAEEAARPGPEIHGSRGRR